MSKQLALLDYCYPDYFSGYSKPVIAVSINETLSNKAVAVEIQNELNEAFELYDEETVKYADVFCEELLQNPDEIFIEQELLDDDDWETPYLYFGVIEPTYKHCLMFLNP